MNINCNRKSTISLLTFSIPVLNNWKYQKIAKEHIGETWKDPRRTQEDFQGWRSSFLQEHQMGILVQGVASLVMSVAILILPSMQIPLGILAATTFLNACYSQMLQRKDLATACGLKVQTGAELHQKIEQFKQDIEKKLEENQDQEALDITRKNEFLSHHDKTSLIALIAKSAHEKKNYAVAIQADFIGDISLTILKNLVLEKNFEMTFKLITNYKDQILHKHSFICYLVSKEHFDFAEQVAAVDKAWDFEILKNIPTLRKIDERIENALNLTDEEEQRVALIKVLLSFSEEDVIQKAIKPGYERDRMDGFECDFLKKVENKLIEKQKYTLLAKVLAMYCRFYLPSLTTCLEKVLQNNGYDEAFEIVKLSKNRYLPPSSLVKLICNLSDPNFEKALLAAGSNRYEALKEEILPRLVQLQKYEQAFNIVAHLPKNTWEREQQNGYLCLVQLFCNANPPELERAKEAFQKISENYIRWDAAEIIKAIDPSFDH